MSAVPEAASRRARLADVDLAALTARHPSAFRPDWGRRAVVAACVVAPVALFAYALASLDVSWSRVFAGLGRLGDFVGLMLPPSYGTTAKLLTYLHALAETLAIAFLGTLLAAMLALPLGFLAARNVIPTWIFRFGVRRFLDTVRSVDTLIWALIWINVVGLGPFAGVLAIMSSDFGAFGKLFSEAIEAADNKAVEGVESAGGSRLHGVRFGLLPQVLPVMASQVLYFFESNTRSATIIGIVGAGGIGQYLYEEIKVLEWGHVSFLVLLVLAAVVLIDAVSARLRFAVIGNRPQR
ncbi:phosphonate ABC transporter, permease protein PhnE [Alsobacter metallidurans]|uniref:Phosphonate ABC transporter, permease protein PhnE n=1 Tax=Alsobacter metallidurans TaxID=340221 RepID=A0A917I6B5_9HYPH|nr:phosphonate ABC transporter, permease protein PhnE [Alsobacter metallidurans]GGH16007.1 phosphonate ABC transporter, permease protein PhnE [Alsobacter metallidurans]